MHSQASTPPPTSVVCSCIQDWCRTGPRRAVSPVSTLIGSVEGGTNYVFSSL